jgi:hypothetical protein
MFPRRPKLDPRMREDVALYSTDDLRRVYLEGRNTGLARHGVPSLDELKAEIRRRVWRENWVSRFTLLAAVIGAAGLIDDPHRHQPSRVRGDSRCTAGGVCGLTSTTPCVRCFPAPKIAT